MKKLKTFPYESFTLLLAAVLLSLESNFNYSRTSCLLVLGVKSFHENNKFQSDMIPPSPNFQSTAEQKKVEYFLLGVQTPRYISLCNYKITLRIFFLYAILLICQQCCNFGKLRKSVKKMVQSSANREILRLKSLWIFLFFCFSPVRSMT